MWSARSGWELIKGKMWHEFKVRIESVKGDKVITIVKVGSLERLSET